jgi:hypothetical protein
MFKQPFADNNAKALLRSISIGYAIGTAMSLGCAAAIVRNVGLWSGFLGGVIGGSICGLALVFLLYHYSTITLGLIEAIKIILGWVIGYSLGGLIVWLDIVFFVAGPYSNLYEIVGYIIGGIVTGWIGGMGMALALSATSEYAQKEKRNILVSQWVKGCVVGWTLGAFLEIIVTGALLPHIVLDKYYFVWIVMTISLGGLVSGAIAGAIGGKSMLFY